MAIKHKQHPEAEIQKAFVAWFRQQYPDILMYSTENGGERSFRSTNHLKAMGMLPGVPDIFIAQPNKKFCGFYIEFKAGGNTPTETQNDFKGKALAAGYQWLCLYSFDAALLYVKDYLASHNR